MRALLLVIGALGAGTAITTAALADAVAAPGAPSPGPAKRKSSPDKFTKAAGDAFAAALAADQANDLRAALGLYQKAYAISAHPSTIYNIADVQRRLSQLTAAIKSYETYLVLSPASGDRAEVEALIDKLRTTPGTIYVLTSEPSDPRAVDLAGAYVLVDGEIRRKPGPLPPPGPGQRGVIELSVPPGKHTVDVVTPVTYGTVGCEVGPGATTQCHIRADPRIDGSAIVSASARAFQVRREPRDRTLLYHRFELARGRHKLALKDRSYECSPLVLEVAGGNTVAYVFVSSTEYDGLQRCRTLDVKQQRLTFAP
ncbi:MAG: hypothetical protein M3680_31070 [Myxococcota bacterium]|nr:hypothetical protein [Myxococcota bacterium]